MIKKVACAMDYDFGRFLRRQENVYEKVLEQFFDVEADPVTSGLADGSIVDISYRKYLIAVDL